MTQWTARRYRLPSAAVIFTLTVLFAVIIGVATAASWSTLPDAGECVTVTIVCVTVNYCTSVGSLFG